MSLDRLRSRAGLFVVDPEATTTGFPGAVALGSGAGTVEGGAASQGGALYQIPVQKAVADIPTLASSGTITHSGSGTVVVTTGGAVTGAIVQVGTRPGQKLTVINNSANTITMAVVGTSNVANGTGCIISALAAITLTWNALDSRWYQDRAA